MEGALCTVKTLRENRLPVFNVILASNYQIDSGLEWSIPLSTTIMVITLIKMLWTNEAPNHCHAKPLPALLHTLTRAALSLLLSRTVGKMNFRAWWTFQNLWKWKFILYLYFFILEWFTERNFLKINSVGYLHWAFAEFFLGGTHFWR